MEQENPTRDENFERMMKHIAEREEAARARLSASAKAVYEDICRLVDERIAVAFEERELKARERLREALHD